VDKRESPKYGQKPEKDRLYKAASIISYDNSMNPQDEIEQMKKDIVILQAMLQFQAASHQALLGAFLHSIGTGTHGAQTAQLLEKGYQQTVEQTIEGMMAAIADDHPDFATEIHNIFQECLKKKP
jgi:hypothetical protein